MAVITRIQFVNFLSEGWQPAMGAARWRPLWPANTITLGGKSTALQIDNGSGKTSATNAILYLLSRDKRLKPLFMNRCAPYEAGYTHVRIEFGIPNEEADVLQADMLPVDPTEFPGTTYVIGVCANRGDDDRLRFYRYCGLLEDAPAFDAEDGKIRFVDNETFKNRVTRIARAEWNVWPGMKDWARLVSEFISADVVRQNVQFHLRGGGDASASLQNIQVRVGERFDEAFFRQVVAPQLLSNAMGESAEEDERTIEDTITRSMYRFIDAKLNVEKKERYLEQREEAEQDFVPVQQAAGAIVEAERDYERRLAELTSDAALLEEFGSPDRGLPGIPRAAQSIQVPAEVAKLLDAMAVDLDGTVLIQDAGLAAAVGRSTSQLNEQARRSSSVRRAVPPYAASAQVIDFKCDLKISEGAGGRRYAENYYDESAAMELLGRGTEQASGALSTLKQAFELARGRLESNAYRHEARRVRRVQTELRTKADAHAQASKDAEATRQRLETSQRERRENEAAYIEYRSQSALVPAAHRAPLDAQLWLQAQLQTRQQAVRSHDLKVGELTPSWNSWKSLHDRLGFDSLDERLEQLRQQHTELEERFETAQSDKNAAESDWNAHHEVLRRANEAKTTAGTQLGELCELHMGSQSFAEVFGAVDPLQVSDPVEDFKQLTRDTEEAERKMRAADERLRQLRELKSNAALARELFEPEEIATADPIQALHDFNEDKRLSELEFSQHQPLAEAFAAFTEKFVDATPATWLAEADTRRTQAIQEASQQRARADTIAHEIASLEATARVDDEEYAAAGELLARNAIPFECASAMVLSAISDKQLALRYLSALARLTSAPVVKKEHLDRALAVLQDAQRNVVVLVWEQLRSLLDQQPNTYRAGAAVGVLAGVRTRRIEALVDPAALAAEINSLRAEQAACESRTSELEREASTLAPQSDDYSLALRAREAQVQKSVRKAKLAESELARLDAAAPRIQRRASAQVLASLHAARALASAGGEKELIAANETHGILSAGHAALTARLRELTPKTTPQARDAWRAARALAAKGGLAALNAARARAAEAAQELQQQIDWQGELQRRIETLRQQFDEVSRQRTAFSHTYSLECAELKAAIDFEKSGHHNFMAARTDIGENLTKAVNELAPLQRVNFERAAAYLDNGQKDSQQLQDEIAEAVRLRDQEAGFAQEMERQAQAMDETALDAERAAKMLHAVAHLLLIKRATIAPYLQDLARRETGPSPSAAHPLFSKIEELRFRLMHWSPEKGYFELDALKSLAAELEQMDLSSAGTQLRDSRRAAKVARSNFVEARKRYCERMAAKPDNPLSQAELEAIGRAETADQIQALADLAKQLRNAIEQERKEYQQLQDTVLAVENESLDTLTRLVVQAKFNLEVMNKTMRRNEKARFEIEATVIADEEIRKLMVELRDHIEQVRREVLSRARIVRQDRDDTSIRSVVREALALRVFVGVSVKFRHIGIWDGEVSHINSILSEGQKATLQMMWLIKESEYHLERAVREHLGKGSRKKLLSRSKRVLFFDGLFSNLSDSKLIGEAFKGLSEAGSNLQLVGLIHNPEYRNDFTIFPSFMIGKRAGWNGAGARRSYVAFRDGRDAGSMGLASFVFRPAQVSTDRGADGGA